MVTRLSRSGFRGWLTLVTLASCALAAFAQTSSDGGEPISPIEPAEVADTNKRALGEALFNDPRLSRDGSVSCASCHQLDQGGDDGSARSASRRPLDFNTPTIFNAARNFRLNWRGNFRSLEEQNEAVLLDPSLMDIDWGELLSRLREDRAYARQFTSVYGAPADREKVLDALAAFQRTLVTPDARFDRYLRGERDALTSEEQRGYTLFKDYGCTACHQGANVGGNLFQKFGIFDDPFAGRRVAERGDLGRFTITGLDQDRHVFRVPSLRNVGITAPYFHHGRTASLPEAVRIMGRSQLGRELPDRDIKSIVAFLHTLTGEYRGRPLARGENEAGP